MISYGEFVIRGLIWFGLTFCLIVVLPLAALSTWNQFAPRERRLSWSVLADQHMLFPKLWELFFIVIGATGALFAILIYRETTTLSMLESLEARDRQMGDLYVVANGSAVGEVPQSPDSNSWQGQDLMRVFADNPPFLHIRSYSECSPALKQKIHAWAADTFNRSAHIEFEWKYIDDLYDQVWASKNVLDERSALARVLAIHASNYLYIVNDAIHTKQAGYFNQGEFSMWGAYLNDMTPSPFFLLALKDGLRYGYLMPETTSYLRKYYLSDDQANNHCVIDAVYPAFWSDQSFP